MSTPETAQPETAQPETAQHEVTRLLERWSAGNAEALDRLVPLVYDEMRQLAARYLRRERPDHTLQATALVHEAYFRLTGKKQAEVKNRGHFLAVAARAMRWILMDHGRRLQAGKRINAFDTVCLEHLADLGQEPKIDLLALHEALSRLAEIDERQLSVVELRYFGGLTVEETAEVLGWSVSSVERFWRLARLWLRDHLKS